MPTRLTKEKMKMQVIHKPKPKPELMTQTELLAYVHELENENARLKESFQRATGEITADPLPGAVVGREQFNRAANEIGDSIEDGNDKMAIAVFVNSLEERLFGGADDDR